MTLREVARSLHPKVSVSYLSHIELGRRAPDTTLLFNMSKVMHCSPRDFFDDASTITYMAALSKLKMAESDLDLLAALRRNNITTPEKIYELARLYTAIKKQLELTV